MDVDLEACIRGDKRAWDAFVDHWAGIIHAAVQRAFQGGRGAAARAEVEDTVQDVFLRLVKDDCRLLRSYDANRASLSTWLTLVARSTAIDRLRRKRPPPTVPLEASDMTHSSHSSHSSQASRAARLHPEIPLHVLSARQRLVMTLLFDEQLSVAEAAGFIGVDEQTIRSTKHKALTRLREHLGEQGTDPFPGCR